MGHPDWQHGPSDDDELFMYLELDQLSAGRRKRLPRAELGSAARAGLWALRIFCFVVSAMVIYTFIAQLS
jgi:hypothetical protein